jgi:hypothetical protein
VNDSTCVVVFGLPRSGTSAVAGVLMNLGVYMGIAFTEPDEINPTGYHEGVTFVEPHANATHTKTFWQMVKTSKNVMLGNYYRITNEVAKEIYEMNIDSRVSHRRYWGVKDPRFIFPYLLSDFINIAKQRCTVKLIGTKRPIDHVVNSLSEVVNGKITDDNRADIISYMSYMDGVKDQMVRDYNGEKMVIHFDSLIDETEDVVNDIADFIEVSLNQAAIDFIRPDLRRHSSG